MATSTLPRGDARPQPPAPRRLAWLDALRGVAALIVVFEHSIDPLYPEMFSISKPWFDAGKCGVLVFFLVSGYVVPASLERRGDVRAFWTGRLFRLYPLWLVAIAGAILLAVTGLDPMGRDMTDRPDVTVLAHLTMLQDMLRVPNALNVLWTLSFEMVFYLLVTAMFVAGVHRRSAETAFAFAAGALALGAVLPAAWISRTLGVSWTVYGVSALMAAGMVLLLRERTRRYGAAVLGVLALTLLAVNSRVGVWEAFLILATMFSGTALYRLERGTLPKWRGVPLVAAVPVLSVAAAIWLSAGWSLTDSDRGVFLWTWSSAVVVAWAVFLAGMALRGREIPRVLTWLGMISYSVYLLHPLVMETFDGLIADPAALPLSLRLAFGVLALLVLLTASAAAYRWIEAPMQNLGRRLSRRPAPPAPHPIPPAPRPAP
ncbi:acyltransferase family protein [Bailinhaonella thermotolerans]|uniref:Acyltransferase n=1 Tax=Bailinhaonella thermotolerans TaxID=1070861 RepID=A0A3A4ARF5_9ACTN|nr:acyltransferase [Bailinhaonella thermotolerans]RJL31691.1 acyltransferase [Bailinhaonella thermotolerans]